MKRTLKRRTGRLSLSQPVDDDPSFFCSEEISRERDGDRVLSCLESSHLIETLSKSKFKIVSVDYLSSAPFAGVFGFFGMKCPKFFVRIDGLYQLFAKSTGFLKWNMIIDAESMGSFPS